MQAEKNPSAPRARMVAQLRWTHQSTLLVAVGTQHRIEYVAASAGWTNWLLLTNLALPASPYVFLDYDSLGAPARLYRTTLMP